MRLIVVSGHHHVSDGIAATLKSSEARSCCLSLQHHLKTLSLVASISVPHLESNADSSSQRECQSQYPRVSRSLFSTTREYCADTACNIYNKG